LKARPFFIGVTVASTRRQVAHAMTVQQPFLGHGLFLALALAAAAILAAGRLVQERHCQHGNAARDDECPEFLSESHINLSF
jgi:hypothetical protein